MLGDVVSRRKDAAGLRAAKKTYLILGCIRGGDEGTPQCTQFAERGPYGVVVSAFRTPHNLPPEAVAPKN